MAELIFAASLQVFATCKKCKKRIESDLLKLNGISNAKWSIHSKLLTINYNPHLIQLEEIHEAVNSIGYDTELSKTTNVDYKKLPKSCQH